MKTKKLIAALQIITTILGCTTLANAQSWNINGNANIAAGTNYIGTSDPNDLVFRSNAIERGRVFGVGGVWRFGTATNNAQIDSTGKLTFAGSGAYQVAGNKYAFQYKNDPDFGLFFNSTNVRYEFRNGTANPVFYINAANGALSVGDLNAGTNFILPSARGINNQILKTDGAGNVSWSTDNNTTYTAGTGLSLAGTTFNNTAPDQTVTLAGSNGITTGGIYPNFTLSGAGLWRTTGNAGTTPATNFIGTTDAQAFAFRTSNSERMRIGSDGKTGIGTSTPTARLHINGTSGEDALRIQTNGTTRLFVDDAGGVSIGSLTPGPAGGMYISGSLGVGNSAPVNKLDVTGNIGLTGSISFANAAAGSGFTFTDGQSIRDNSGNTALEVEIHGDWLPDVDNSHSLGNSTQRWIDVWALDGTINTSDLRDKTNVNNLRYGLKEIMALRPVSFKWKDIDSKQDKLGVIAQEIQKVMPEVVRDYEYKVDETTGKKEKVPSARLGVMYADIIPVLIKAIQEQQLEIEALKKTNGNAASTSAAPSVNEVSSMNVKLSTAALEQNIPNPLHNNTSIRYNIPVDAKNASLIITDINGKTIKQISLKAGNGVINVDATSLNSGTYNYTLIIDGRTIETKRMVVAK